MPIRYAIDNMPAGLGAAPEAAVSQRITIDNWPTGFEDGSQARSQFIANILAITGDTRLFWLPASTDTTTSTDKSLNGRTITHNVTIADRLSALGLGYAVSFNGTSHYSSVADADGLSFGDGSTDSAFSIIVLANVVNSAAARTLVSKWNNGDTVREYNFYVTTTDQIVVDFYDESANQQSRRASTAAATMGSRALFAFTYSAATGGATAGDDVTIYENGAEKASSATNNASYVSLENTATPLNLGARISSSTTREQFLSTELDLVIICQKNLSASEHWTIKEHINAYFGLSL